MSRVITFLMLVLMASPVVAGHVVCRTQTFVQPVGAYYYTAQPQAVQAPTIGPGDVQAILNAARSNAQLLQGLQQIQAESYRATLIQSQAFTAGPQSIQAPAPQLGQAEQLIQAKCARCHSGETPKGGASIINNGFISSEWASPKGRRAIVGYVVGGDMPPKPAEPLTADEAEVLLEWARGGK